MRVPEGLIVDTDLRWRLLHALVAHGVAGETEIDEELRRDPTSTGQRQAERARALVPTAEAKERAWQRAVYDDDIPNAVQEAIISGFSHPAQRALLGGYVERYFDVVAEVWSRRTSERAQAVVVGLFPSWAVDQEHGRRGRCLAGRRIASARAAPVGLRGPGRHRAGAGGTRVRPVLAAPMELRPGPCCAQ